MSNKKLIVSHLIQLAKYEPTSFKAAAYITAASNISKANHENWSEIPGVGKAIFNKINELLETGKIDKLERLKAEYVEKKKEQKYITYDEATTLLNELSLPFKHVVCGSYRREKDTISDIDILILDTDVEKVKEHMSKIGVEFVNSGDKQFDVIYKDVLINFRSTFEEGWGAGMLYLTGSGKFGVLIRGLAKKKSFKLNQYGLFKGEELIASKTEEDIFKALELIYVEPKYR